MLTPGRRTDAATATLGVGAALVAIGCCAGLPAVGALLGGLTLGAILGFGLGALTLTALAFTATAILRRRREAATCRERRERR